MLTIHDKVPADMEYVKDNELYFGRTTCLLLDERAQNIITIIDKGNYYDRNKFIDRLGLPCRVLDLSTGCKTVLNVLYNPAVCFDTVECGINAIDVLLELNDGNVLFRKGVLFWGDRVKKVCWRDHGIAGNGIQLSGICREVWPDEND